MNPLTVTPLSIKIFEYLLSSGLEKGIRNLLCTSTFLWRTFHSPQNPKWWHFVSTSLPVIHGRLLCESTCSPNHSSALFWWIKKLFDLHGSMLHTIALPLCGSCHQATITEIKKRGSLFVSLTCISNLQPQLLHDRNSIRKHLPLRGTRVNFTESNFCVQNVPPDSLFTVRKGNYWEAMVTFLCSLQYEDLEDSRFAKTASSIRVWVRAWFRTCKSLDFIFTPLETTTSCESIEWRKSYCDALRMLFLALFVDGFGLKGSCRCFPAQASAKYIRQIWNDFGLDGESHWHAKYLLTSIWHTGDTKKWIDTWLAITNGFQASSCLFDSKVGCHLCVEIKTDTDEAYSSRRSKRILCVYCFLRLVAGKTHPFLTEEIDLTLKTLVLVCEPGATEAQLFAYWQKLPSSKTDLSSRILIALSKGFSFKVKLRLIFKGGWQLALVCLSILGKTQKYVQAGSEAA